MATIGTKIHTWLFGQFVGADEYGNRYYQDRKVPADRRRARWVIYKGLAEASKVPPHWHGWLHYTHNDVPSGALQRVYHWQKAAVPNLTGTPGAYLPPGHVLKGGQRAAATADYQPWKPE